jgi:hypothetical protein
MESCVLKKDVELMSACTDGSRCVEKKRNLARDAGKRASRFGGALLALDLKACVIAVFACLAPVARRAVRGLVA